MIETKYLYLLTVLSLVIGLGMRNKYIFAVLLVVSISFYLLAASREGFEVNSILEYFPLIRNVELGLSSDVDAAKSEEEEEKESENKLDSSPVKYGDEILIQCLTMDGKYLTGNRDGFNDADPTGNNSEAVFTTDEDYQVLLWKIEPSKNHDQKMNTPVLKGDTVIFKCLNDETNSSVLIANQRKAPYSHNSSTEYKAGVYTRSVDNLPNNYSDHLFQFIIEKDDALKYNSPVMIKTNDTLHLTGARQFGYLDNQSNQQVYSLNTENDEISSFYWCIKREKGPRPHLNIINKTIKQHNKLLPLRNTTTVKDFGKAYDIQYIELEYTPKDFKNTNFKVQGINEEGFIVDISDVHNINFLSSLNIREPLQFKLKNSTLIDNFVGFDIDGKFISGGTDGSSNVQSKFILMKINDKEFMIANHNKTKLLTVSGSEAIMKQNGEEALNNSDFYFRLSESGILETKTGKQLFTSGVSIDSENEDLFKLKIPINMKLESVIVEESNIASIEAYDNNDSVIDSNNYITPDVSGNNNRNPNENNINEKDNVIINLNERTYVNGLVLNSNDFNTIKFNIYVSNNGINYKQLGSFETKEIPIYRKTKFIKIEPIRCNNGVCSFSSHLF